MSILNNATIKVRRDTTSNWNSNNPTLNQGEFGLDLDLLYLKIGDGSTVWNSLAYIKDVAAATITTLTSTTASIDSIVTDLSIDKSNAWLTLDSPGTGDTGTDQAAGISIGESGYKGEAALHLTYTGDGLSHIGMGTVSASTSLPAYEVMRLHYTSNNATFLGDITVTGCATIDGIRLQDSSDRSGLLEIYRKGTTTYSGIQTRFSSSAQWSLMGHQTQFGLYDDYNAKWGWRYNENAGITLYNNGSSKLFTHSTGIDVTGEIHINDSSTKLMEGGGNSIRNQTAYGYVDIGPENTSGCHIYTDRAQFFFNKHILCASAGAYDLGSSTYYFRYLNYKGLYDRGCLGCYDSGVEMQDGSIVSDIEAIQAIKKHPTKKTMFGVDKLDYSTFPKHAYDPEVIAEKDMYNAGDDGKERIVTKKGDVHGEEGIEMTTMFSIFIGAFKELDNRMKILEKLIADKEI